MNLLDLLFPPKCPFCRALLEDGERDLCARCQRELPWCLGALGEQKLEFIPRCVSPLFYQDRVRDSFHRYKFGGGVSYARPYGLLMAQCVEDRLAGEFDLITWAPLSPKRRRKRGYDQARLLAQALGRRLGVPVRPLLAKTRHTGAQSALEDDGARRANVLGAYSPVDTAQIAGQRLLLVDDIVTTGATLSECARVLRTYGAAEVLAVTLARARK